LAGLTDQQLVTVVKNILISLRRLNKLSYVPYVGDAVFFACEVVNTNRRYYSPCNNEQPSGLRSA
jgi:hypothetical protein